MILNTKSKQEFERISTQDSIVAIPNSLLLYIEVKNEINTLIFRLDLVLACKDYALAMLNRDAAQSLKSSLEDIRKIEEHAGQLARLLKKCDPAVLEWLKDRGPLSLYAGEPDTGPLDAECVDILPSSGADLHQRSADGGMLINILRSLSRRASLTASSIQKYVGAPSSDAVASGGRQSVNILSSAHPSWKLTVALAQIFGQNLDHEFGTHKNDYKRFSVFVQDVLRWRFEQMIDLERAYVRPFLQCVARLYALQNKEKKEIMEKNNIVGNFDQGKHGSVQNKLLHIKEKIAAEERLLFDGPSSRARKNFKSQSSQRNTSVKVNLTRMHIVDWSHFVKATDTYNN